MKIHTQKFSDRSWFNLTERMRETMESLASEYILLNTSTAYNGDIFFAVVFYGELETLTTTKVAKVIPFNTPAPNLNFPIPGGCVSIPESLDHRACDHTIGCIATPVKTESERLQEELEPLPNSHLKFAV